MTQNPYPAPQPGWQPPAQQGPPPGWTPPPAPDAYQQQFGHPQQPPAGPPPAYGTPPAAAAGADEFSDPGQGMGGDGDSPALHQLEGRLILWRPRKGSKAMGTGYDRTTQEEQMRVDLVVCDGDPIPAHVNGDTMATTPFAAGPKVAPFYVGSVRVNKVLLDKLGEHYDSPDPRATCLARYVKTPPKGPGKPYSDLRVATEADKVLARQILPRWDELKAAATAVRPDQFGGVQSAGPPPAWAQAPQGPPPGYGQPPAPAQYPPADTTPWGQQPPPPPGYQQGPPPGWNGQPTH